MDNLHDDSSARGGARFFRNVLEMLFDRLFCRSHFVGYFLIGPAFQEMLNDHCFECGQIKSLLRLGDGLILVLPHANADFTYHNEDSFFRVNPINQGRAAQYYGTVGSVHDASELNLLPVLRIGSSLEDFPHLIGETSNSRGEHLVCGFSILASFVRMTLSWIVPQFKHRDP